MAVTVIAGLAVREGTAAAAAVVTELIAVENSARFAALTRLPIEMVNPFRFASLNVRGVPNLELNVIRLFRRMFQLAWPTNVDDSVMEPVKESMNSALSAIAANFELSVMPVVSTFTVAVDPAYIRREFSSDEFKALLSSITPVLLSTWVM